MDAYRNDLITYADFLETQFEITDAKSVARRHISSFIAHLSETGLSTRSINRKLSAIQSFGNFLVREQKVEHNVARKIQRPKTPQILPQVVRYDALEELLTDVQFPEDFEGRRDRLMLLVFYLCGLRRDELIQLTTQSVDLVAGSVKVTGKRNKERIVPLNPLLVRELELYLDIRSGRHSTENWLFITAKGKKLYPSLVYARVKKYLSQVTSMNKRSPHVLRHTFATHLLDQGAELQAIKELLGHANLSATQVYTHNSLEKIKDVYKKSHPGNQKI